MVGRQVPRSARQFSFVRCALHRGQTIFFRRGLPSVEQTAFTRFTLVYVLVLTKLFTVTQPDASVLSAVASPRRLEIWRLVWDGEQAAGSDQRRPARHHLRRGIAAAAGAVEGRSGGGAPSGPAAVLPGASRTPGGRGARARGDVGGRAVESEARGRTRSRPPRTAPAPPHQGEDRLMSQPLPFRLDRRIVIAAPRDLGLPLLHRQRPLGALVGRRLSDHRGDAGGSRTPSGIPAAWRWRDMWWPLTLPTSYRFHVRVPIRHAHPRGRLARDHPAGRSRRRHARCSCPTSSPTTACATSMSRAGGIRWPFSATSRPTRLSAARPIWWTAGLRRGPIRNPRARRRPRSRDLTAHLVQGSIQPSGGSRRLRPHLAAVHRFMPGLRLTRDGAVRHCQVTVLADWAGPRRGRTGARPRHERVRPGPHGRIALREWIENVAGCDAIQPPSPGSTAPAHPRGPPRSCPCRGKGWCGSA